MKFRFKTDYQYRDRLRNLFALEPAKTPVYYFRDTGLRNWLLGLFGLPSIPSPLSGHLFKDRTSGGT